ncbi:MAG: N-acetylmuramoyl-L-alanine amidase [Candidatus Eisenbacteria bacterium]
MKYCLGILLVVLMAGPCLGQSASVAYSDGRPSEYVPIIEKDETAHISISQVARLLGLEKSVDFGQQKVTLSGGGHAVDILIGATVWIVDGETVAAGEVSFTEEGEVYIGVGSAADVLAPALDKSMRWDEKGKRIIIGLSAPNILDMEVRAARGRVSATMGTRGLLKYTLMPATDGGFEIFIRGGVLAKRIGFESEGGLIEKVSARQEPDGARITVTLGEGKPSYRVFPRWRPDGIVMLVWERALTDIPDPAFKPPKHLAWQERFSGEKARIDLVVIDPGHGGENFGSIGPSGFTEKEFTLGVSKKLKQAFKRRGIDVILTRDDDVYVSLETRTEVANSVGADLFISMHANGFRSPEAKGFEVYFLSPALDDGSRVVAAMENASPAIVAAAGLEPDDEVAFILWDTAQNEFVVESSHLAQLIDEELATRLTIPNRGVKQANFIVLTGAYLPAILVETAFVTNHNEERLLKDEAFQEMVADGIVSAVMRFKEDYNR